MLNNKRARLSAQAGSLLMLGYALTGFAASNPASQDYVDTQIKKTKAQLLAQIKNVLPGQNAYGGVVFFVYVDANGVQHGLVAAPTDEPGGAAYTWGLSTTVGTAQYQCATKTTNGYHDWFVPTIAQASLLFTNRFVVNPKSPNGGFNYNATTGNFSWVYWTSTVDPATPGKAWFTNFSTGGAQAGDLVTSANSVRCIRSF